MIYTFGCSATKWHWPTWADWLWAYGHDVTNLAGKGYCHNFINWTLLDIASTITPNDHVVIMWPNNHRIVQWYDREWVDEYDCEGFFPKTQGRLWFSQDTPYLGLYRTHPDHDISRTHGLAYSWYSIFQAQLLLESIGCQYTMTWSQNPWLDARPTYKPHFQTRWNMLNQISDQEYEHAVRVMQLSPVRQLLEKINWNAFVDPPQDIYDPSYYRGMTEYNISKKEFVLYKHETDHHPVSIAHHDYAWNHILKQKTSGDLRDLALRISEEARTMPIPAWTEQDYVAPVGSEVLDPTFKNLLLVDRKVF